MAIAFANATTATGNNGGNNAATVTINVPASTADGDMLILAVVVSESAGVAPTCAGWTLKETHNGVQEGLPYDSDLTVALFYRRASSEPASYNVLTDGTYGNYSALAMLRYTGVVTTGDPFRTSETVSRCNPPFSAAQTSTVLMGVQSTDMALHLSGAAMGAWNTDVYDLAGPGGGWTERGEVYMTPDTTGKPSVMFLEQLGAATAPVVTSSGTAMAAGNISTVFAAGALMAAGGPASPSVFTSTGSWTAPAGVTTAQVECWAGGGAGGSGSVSGAAGGGGAGGCYAKTAAYAVTPTSSYTVTVGAGGVHKTPTTNTASNPGGDTWFDSTSGVLAKGGAAGGDRSTSGAGTAGAGSSTGCVGGVVAAGGSGAAGVSATIGGGGGGGAGSGGAGGAASGATAGAGTATGGGAGSAGVSATSANSPPVYGGGGGGARAADATDRLGGTGAPGLVMVSWTEPVFPGGSKVYTTAVRRSSTW